MKISSKKFEDIVIGFLIISILSFHDCTEIMLIAQIVAFIFEILKNKGELKITYTLKKYLLWSLIFLLFCIMSSIWALNRDTLFSCIISICQVIMTSVTLILYYDNSKLNKIIKFIIFSCYTLIFRLILVVPFDAWGNGERIGTYLGNGKDGGYGNTALTYVLSVGAIWVIYKAMISKNKKFKYYITFFIFTLFSMLSGSKKSIIIFFLTLFFMQILNTRDYRKLLKSLIILFLIFIIGWYMIMNNSFLYNSIGYRVEYFINYFLTGETDNSTLTRISYMQQSIDMFKENPILGIGLDGFRYFNNRNAWAENNYLELMVDLGLIGTFIYYIYPISIVKLLFKINKSKKEKKTLISVVMLVFLFIDFSMVTYSNDYLQLYLIIIYLISNDKELYYECNK